VYLELVTPDKKLFEGEVDSATFPGIDGSFQVLNNHAAMISALKEGTVTIADSKSTEEFLITGGVVEVLHNRVTVLAEGIKEG